MELIECNKEYWEFVRTLRNNDQVQDGFIETIEITSEMQNAYMNKYSDCYRIALIEYIQETHYN